MNIARIHDGRVVEIIAPMFDENNVLIPVENRFHPDLLPALVPCDESVQEGDGYDGAVFSKPAPPAAPNLDDVKRAAVKQIDADVDAIYGELIGNRQAEYDLAEREAAEFKAAGYPAGAVPESVQFWADAKAWTPKKAADDILATSTAWRQAQNNIRKTRLATKEAARKATDAAGVDAVLADWGAYVKATRAGLGV